MTVCPQCGTENREEARFCDSCGAELSPEKASPREERKIVTVLFADLVGFTSRAELAAASQFVEAGQRARAESELQQSLTFWRSVHATAYVREGEALLAASA